LRNVVGERARQAGSLVTPDGLRFDFPLERGLTQDERRAIEAEVRTVIREDRPVIPALMSMADAIAAGADAFFDEKYGETVRTVRVEGYSHELCGGTHCRATGQVGGFVIVGEKSIGTGMRRIEALTGEAADAYLDARREILERAADLVGAQTVDAVPERIAAVQEELRETKRRLRAGAAGGVPRPAELRERVVATEGGMTLLPYAGPFESIDAMKGFAKDLRSVVGANVIALGLDAEEPQLFVTADETAVGGGVSAGELVRSAAAHIDGKGGGRPEMAQGKGTRREGLPAALASIAESLGATNGASG
jgi:alanyl-tRNA synthetase